MPVKYIDERRRQRALFLIWLVVNCLAFWAALIFVLVML